MELIEILELVLSVWWYGSLIIMVFIDAILWLTLLPLIIRPNIITRLEIPKIILLLIIILLSVTHLLFPNFNYSTFNIDWVSIIILILYFSTLSILIKTKQVYFYYLVIFGILVMIVSIPRLITRTLLVPGIHVIPIILSIIYGLLSSSIGYTVLKSYPKKWIKVIRVEFFSLVIILLLYLVGGVNETI